MEEVFLRFPHLSEDIFNNLDIKTLANCEEASKVWFAHLDDQNFLRLRRVEIIKKKQSESFNNLLTSGCTGVMNFRLLLIQLECKRSLMLQEWEILKQHKNT